MAKAPARKMTNMVIKETSGVDHPAHEHEGWIVMKSAGAASVESLFGALNKAEEGLVPDIKKEEAELTPEEKLAAAEARAEAAEKALADKAEADAKVEADAAAAAAAEAAAGADDEEDLEKSLAKLPEPVRKALAKQSADLAKAREDFVKERDQRLDTEAIAKSKDIFKSLAIEHAVVAPALRRVAILDADLAKAIETTLSAADAQLAAGVDLTKEIGNPGAGDGNSAVERITKAADALVAADPKLSPSQAFVKAIEDNPELHAAYTAEKAGK